MLRRVGFDLLLRRPVHPVALRLVILRALYGGEEKRREERVAIGLDVQFRTGFWRKKALLADISQRGCRLLADQALPAGTRVNLPLPREISADGLTLPCKVVRVAAKPEEDGRIELGLAFENLPKEKLAELRALMKQLSDAVGMEEGRVFGVKARPTSAPAAKPAPSAAAAPRMKPAAPLRLPSPPKALPPPPRPAQATAPAAPAAAAPRKAPSAAAAPAAPAASASQESAERRKQPRAAFDRKIERLDDEANSVLFGRDLSLGGMRIDYHPRVQVGDVLELAVYASAREEPIIVKARVGHDAGDGLGVVFEGLPADVGARLEKVVARLPSVESLQGGEAAGVGSVVSRVLSGFRRED
jgi:hypothetical protein